MTNIFDYLKWRGDLKISQAPFNHVDALILSRLSYVPFEDIVSYNPLEKITLRQAAHIFFSREISINYIFTAQDIKLLEAMMRSERFKDMRLSGYINEVDYETQKQFAAIIIDVGHHTHFISYRGTDNTLVGWKEDFNMSFMSPVPAQEAAVHYLEKMAESLPGYIRTGGHSKGGNLAVYAASLCSTQVQKRIIEVYNNDGPGFDSKIISMEGYVNIRGRINTFVPQSSVVGMLLEHEEEYRIVHSTQTGLLQHDIYSWEVMGNDFIYLDTVSNRSLFIDRTLKDWMLRMDSSQREQFIEAIYSIFNETNAKTLEELTSNWYKNALIILKSLKNMDNSLKQFTSQTLSLLIKSARQNLLMLKSNNPTLIE